MDLSKMTPEEARAIVTQAQNVFDASIADQQRTSPKEIQELPLDLSVARTRSNAMKVSFPFKSLLVEQATDLNTYIYLIPISNDNGNDPIKLGLKDVYKSEFGFRECYIYWDAQPAKQMILKFFVRSIIENGRLLLDQNSTPTEIIVGYGTSQNDGFTFVLQSTFFNIPATGFTKMDNPFRGLNDFSLNDINNTISVNPGDRPNQFKVPNGYTAEIIGAEIEITEVLPGGVFALVCAVQNNSTFGSASACSANSVTRIGDSLNKALGTVKYYPNSSASGGAYPNGNLNRMKNIFYENEILACVVYSSPAGNAHGGGSGRGNFRIMVRLTKNVG